MHLFFLSKADKLFIKFEKEMIGLAVSRFASHNSLS
jgi:hypothetical protein